MVRSVNQRDRYNTPIFSNQCISQIINPTDNVKELREGIKNYIEYYNTKRPHLGVEHQIPMTKYAKIAA